MTIRGYFLFYVIFFVILGGVLFHVKYTVLDLENENKRLRNKISEIQEEINVLNAEWAYLNEPERLFKLTQKYLNLRPIRGQQIVSYTDLDNSGFGNYDRDALKKIIDEKSPTSKGISKFGHKK